MGIQIELPPLTLSILHQRCPIPLLNLVRNFFFPHCVFLLIFCPCCVLVLLKTLPVETLFFEVGFFKLALFFKPVHLFVYHPSLSMSLSQKEIFCKWKKVFIVLTNFFSFLWNNCFVFVLRQRRSFHPSTIRELWWNFYCR